MSCGVVAYSIARRVGGEEVDGLKRDLIALERVHSADAGGKKKGVGTSVFLLCSQVGTGGVNLEERVWMCCGGAVLKPYPGRIVDRLSCAFPVDSRVLWIPVWCWVFCSLTVLVFRKRETAKSCDASRGLIGVVTSRK